MHDSTSSRLTQYPSLLMKDEAVEEIFAKPEDGCYITRLFLEGARWDKVVGSLVDPKSKELFSPMPTIHMLPVQNRKTLYDGIYRCSVYKVLTRSGTLSTTGHSTNFVTWIEIPSKSGDYFPIIFGIRNKCPGLVL